jgi:FkbM family methyltransferase
MISNRYKNKFEYFLLRKKVKNWVFLFLITDSIILQILSKIRDDILIKLKSNYFYLPIDKVSEGPSFLISNKEHYIDQLKLYFPDFLINSNDKVLDIGAHVGLVGISLIEKYNCFVYFFEASPKNYKMLKKNINLHNLANMSSTKNVIVWKNNSDIGFLEGQSSTVGHVEALGTYKFVGNNIKRNFAKKNKQIRNISTISINQVFEDINSKNFKLLKIDIEGAEYEVLSNLDQKYLRSVEYVVIESHLVEDTKMGKKWIIELLIENGFKIEVLSYENGCSEIYGQNLNIN